MTEAAPAIFVALEQSAFAAAIRQSPWLYPAANVGHILSLIFFVAAVAVMDVRLLARARNLAIAAFAGMAVTGFMLFSAEASHLVLNPVFQLKAALVAAGLANIAIYEFWAKAMVQRLVPGAPMPPRAKIAGALSLGIWLGVADCGRGIAYF